MFINVHTTKDQRLNVCGLWVYEVHSSGPECTMKSLSLCCVWHCATDRQQKTETAYFHDRRHFHQNGLSSAKYLGVQRWSPGPTWLNSRWRSAGGTWCVRLRDNCGSGRRQSHSSAARSRLLPSDQGRHHRAERKASATHSGRKFKPHVCKSLWTINRKNATVVTLSISAVDRGWYLRSRALATWRQEQLYFSCCSHSHRSLLIKIHLCKVIY